MSGSTQTLSKAKRIALLGILAAAAIVLSIFENSLTGMMNFALPGLKPGFSNIAVVVALIVLGGRYAVVISLIKAFASFFATGSVTVLWFSLAASLLSVLAMIILYRTKKFSPIGISAAGGVFSGLGQIIVICALSGTPLYFYYLPILSIFGVLFGAIMGFLAEAISKIVLKQRKN